MKRSKLTAKEVDEKFDNGEELEDFFTEELDPETYLPKKKKISAELPMAMIKKIDSIVEETGNTRNAVIRMLIARSLEITGDDKSIDSFLVKLGKKYKI